MTDTVHIDVPPEQVWEWIEALADHYTDWHPDHVSAQWTVGEPNEVGSILEVVEHIGGRRERLHFELTEVDPPHSMRYRIQGAHSVLLPGGSFSIAHDGDGSSFTATIDYRFGALLERLFPRMSRALREHMREEGVNVQRLLSGKA
jgi:carbon monoxide dehydrogenase subunit G